MANSWKKVIVSGSDAVLNTLAAPGGITGNLTGNVTGNASTATSASHAAAANLATTASHAVAAKTASYALDADAAATAVTANTASYVLAANVSGKVATAGTADTASYVTAANVSGLGNAATQNTGSMTVRNADLADVATLANTATSASRATSAASADLATLATNATTAATASYVQGANVVGKVTAAGTADTASYVSSANIVGDIALGTQTSGNYVASVSNGAGINTIAAASEGAAPTISVNSSSMATYFRQDAFAAIKGDILIDATGSATIQANSVALGTDTTGNYAASVVAGTNITVTGSAGEGTSFTVALPSTIAGNHIFSNNLQVNGNLTVSGTTTTVNSTVVSIADKFILLAAGQGGAETIAEGGIIVEGALPGQGQAFYYDAISSGRWAVAAGVDQNATTVNPDAFMAVAFAGTAADATTAGFNKAGNIAADSITGDIYIFS